MLMASSVGFLLATLVAPTMALAFDPAVTEAVEDAPFQAENDLMEAGGWHCHYWHYHHAQHRPGHCHAWHRH